MKKLLIILLCLSMIGFGQNVYIPDANFKANLVGSPGINTNGDTEIQLAEAAACIGPIILSNQGISDLTGIEAFTALHELDCSSNQLTSLDVSGCTALHELNCRNNQLTSLNVSGCTALYELDCQGNLLTSLDVSQNTALSHLWCMNNQLISLNVSGATSLTALGCGSQFGDSNQLTSLDVSQNTALSYLWCAYNQLTSLNVSGAINLFRLYCHDNLLTSLDVSQNTALYDMYCHNNQLTSLDISNNTDLTFLQCHNNQLTCLNVANEIIATGIFTVHANNNPNLSCIEVTDSIWSTTNWTNFFGDTQHYFSTNCNNACSGALTGVLDISVNKNKPLKVTDLLGRETKGTNQPLLYIYDDGRVEKRIVIE